jgi:hypothetical protein
VLNYSEHGVLVMSPTRLLPGRRYVLAWPLLPGSADATGVTVRSAVGGLDPTSGVQYQAGLDLESNPPFLREWTTRDE